MTCSCRAINTTAIAVTGDNLVLTVPAGTIFQNCETYSIRLAQPIPATATNLQPVVIQIGTGATLYNVVRKCGHNLYANQLRSGGIYRLLTAADTARFVVVGGNIAARNGGAVTTIPEATANEAPAT